MNKIKYNKKDKKNIFYIISGYYNYSGSVFDCTSVG